MIFGDWGMMKLIVKTVVLCIALVFIVVLGIPRLAVCLNNAGSAAYEQGRYDDALGYFKTALRLAPGSVDTFFNLAVLHEAMKKEDAAVAAYEQAIRLDSQYTPAYRALVEINAVRNNFEEALRIAAQADDRIHSVETDEMKQDVTVRYAAECARIGIDALSAGKKDEGIGFLNKAIALNPGFVLPHEALAYFYFKMGDHRQAETSARMVIKLDPRNLNACQLLADIFMGRQDFVTAVGYYKQALELNKKDASLYNNLGLALMNLERLEEARHYLSKAVMLVPKDVHFRYNLASVCRDGQHFDEAVGFYRQVLAMKPDYPNVHNDLADIYLHRGQDDLAAEESAIEIKNSSKRLEKNPDDIEALNNLAYAYARSGDAARGRTIIEGVIARASTYRQAYLTLAEVCKKLEDIGCAQQAFNQAKTLSKETNFIDRELMKLLEKSKGLN